MNAVIHNKAAVVLPKFFFIPHNYALQCLSECTYICKIYNLLVYKEIMTYFYDILLSDAKKSSSSKHAKVAVAADCAMSLKVRMHLLTGFLMLL